jgi:hypothetical protein
MMTILERGSWQRLRMAWNGLDLRCVWIFCFNHVLCFSAVRCLAAHPGDPGNTFSCDATLPPAFCQQLRPQLM